jgi:hypothetical protein
MRGILLTTLISLVVLLTGCKSKGDANASPDPEALKAQQDLIARRDALMQQRQTMETEIGKLDAEIQTKKAGNEPTEELEKKKADLEAKLKGQDTDLTSLTSKIDQVVSQGGNAAAIATREASMSQREKSVAQREREFADRERQIASREAALAQREKETCGAAAPMIIQSAPPKSGGSYGKSDVTPILAKAKEAMRKKGILAADLPGGAQGLESQATDAMGANDWNKAYFAAQQLLAIVESIKIDRLFIQAKMARMNKQVNASKLDEETNKQLVAILSDVALKYNDGNFAAANTRLNQLASQLNK